MSEGTERLTVTVKWFLPLVFLLCSEPHRQEDSNLTRLMVTTFKLPQTTLKGCNTWSPLTAEKKERCRSQQERLPPPTAALSLQHMLTFLSATAAVTEQVVNKAGNKGETRNTICHCLPNDLLSTQQWTWARVWRRVEPENASKSRKVWPHMKNMTERDRGTMVSCVDNTVSAAGVDLQSEMIRRCQCRWVTHSGKCQDLREPRQHYLETMNEQVAACRYRGWQKFPSRQMVGSGCGLGWRGILVWADNDCSRTREFERSSHTKCF